MPFTQSTDADWEVTRAREQDDQDQLDALVRREQSFTPPQSLSEPTEEPPAPSTPASGNTSPEGAQTPEQGAEKAPTKSMTEDVIVSAVRGPFAELSDIVDNLGLLANDILEPINPAFAVFGLDETNRPMPGQSMNDVANPVARRAFDEKFGTPETLAGGLAQGVTGQLAYILPASRLLKGLGVGMVARSAAASAATAGITQGQDEGNLSNMMVEQGAGNALFDNPLTRALAIQDDDSGFERLSKTIIEDLALSFASELAVAGAKKGLAQFRKAKKAAPEIDANAMGKGILEQDTELRGLVDDLANVRAQKGLVDASLDNMERGAKTLDETAAIKGGPTDAAADAAEEGLQGLEAPVGVVDDAVKTRLSERAAALEATQAEIEGKLRAFAESTTADGRYLEAYRRTIKDSISRETDEALGAAATRNMPPTFEEVKVKAGNYLDTNEGTLALLNKAWAAGDIDLVRRTYGEILDNTNYDNITTEGGLAKLIEANGMIFGTNEMSERVYTTYGLIDARMDAETSFEWLVRETNGHPERIAETMRQLAPDTTNLRVFFNMLRLTEVQVAGALENTLKQWRAAGPSDSLRIKALKWHELSAKLTELRSGMTSDIAGALGDHRLKFDLVNPDDLLRGESDEIAIEMSEHINRHGGRDRIDRAINALAEAEEAGPDVLLKVNSQLKNAATLGDFAYEAFILNILSAPTTQAINLSSNAVRSLAWDPFNKAFEAGGRTILAGDLTGWSALRGHIEGLGEGILGAFRYNATLNATPLQAAWQRGMRLSGRRGGLGAEALPQESLLNTKSLGQLVKDGIPLTRPHRKHQLKLMPLPKAAREGLGDWIASRTGPISSSINYLGSAMGWVGKALAVGDELFAGMSYRAQLYADTVEQAIAEGHSGAKLASRIDELRRSAENIDAIGKNLDRSDLVAVNEYKVLRDLDKGARNHAERATYTAESKIGQKFESFRQNVPVVRWMAPFVRTPLNLASQGIMDFSPLGPAARVMEAAFKQDPKNFSKAMGQLTMVGGIYYGAWKMSVSGRLTGGGPHNPAEREFWRGAEQRPPYSIKIGDKWYAYNRFDPIAMPIGILADLLYLQGRADYKTEFKLHEEAISILFEAVKGRTFLQGISDMFAAAENPNGNFMQNLLVTKAQHTVVPGSRMWASMERGGLPIPADLIIDNFMDGALEGTTLAKFMRGTPEKDLVDTRTPVAHFTTSVYRDLPEPARVGVQKMIDLWNWILNEKNTFGVTPDRDMFGDVRTTPPGMGPDFLSPFQVRDHGEDPLVDEMKRLEFGFSTKRHFGKMYDVELSPEQRDEYLMFFVKPTKDSLKIRELLENVVLDEDGKYKESWLRLGDPINDLPGGKLQLLDKLVGQRMALARKLMVQKHPELKAAWMKQRMEKQLQRSQEGNERIKAGETDPQKLLSALR